MSDFGIFIHNISSYPTIIFTGFMIVASFFWLMSIFGAMDMDSIDLDIDIDITEPADLNFLSGVLFKFGLHGVPFVLMFSIFSLIGWIFSYTYSMFLLNWFPTGVMHYVFGTGAFVVVSVFSMFLTGLIVTPIRKKIEKIPKKNAKCFIGKTAVVRTFTVNDKHGEATLEDGGAGLIFKVRAINETFSQGDKVALVEYVADENIYRVVAENEYLR